MAKSTTKQKPKQVQTAPRFYQDEIDRMTKHMPPGLRSVSTWVRQLALERTAQLEQAKNGSRA